MADGRMPASMRPFKEEMDDVLAKGWINLVHLGRLGVGSYKLKSPLIFWFWHWWWTESWDFYLSFKANDMYCKKAL